ncbi:ATP-dependent DNA ligase [Natronospora cellulosivora (SeqCode)]
MLKPPLNPMLLSVKEEAFNSPNYLFEFKWDGYRCLCFINQGKLYLQSRNKNSLTKYYPEKKYIINNIYCKNAILDGELCFLEEDGKSNFSKLQKNIRYSKKKQSLSLVFWDLISYNDKDLSSLALIERKKQLKSIVKENRFLLISPFIKKWGVKLYQEAEKENLEGIVAKEINSPYEFKRSKKWLKIKCWQYSEAIITAYTNNRLLYLARKDIKGSLIDMGKVKISLEKDIENTLFSFLPTIKIKSIRNNKLDVHKVKPYIKVKVRYTEISSNNTFRHGYVVEIMS